MRSIHIFKKGTHTDSDGVARFFSEGDIRESIAAYDPKKHRAPMVIGHPKTDAPAYGWVKDLSYVEGADAGLYVDGDQVEEQFEEMVLKGRFPERSASFYSPDSPNNPVPGVWYLRHVGFLGAQPPAIKGLKRVEYKAAEQGVVSFMDYDDMTVAGLFRSMREWLIAKFGTDEADKALASYQIDSLQINAATGDGDGDLGMSYSEEQKRMNTVEQREAKVAEREAAIKAREDAIASKETSFAERETKVTARETAIKDTEKTTVRAANVAFCESLVKAGKLLPKDKDGTLALMDGMSAAATVEFGEGATKVTTSPLAIYKAQLEGRDKLVDFGERAGGKTVDLDDTVALTREVRNFMESESKAGRQVSSAEALQAVQNAKS